MNSNQESNLPPYLTLTDTRVASATSSTNVTIAGTSTCVEISAIGGGCYFLVGAGTVSNSNFHGYVQEGATRHYNIIPGTTNIAVLGSEVIVITY